MNNLGTSFVILALALLLLWLAVTDRLSRLLDAWQVVTGKSTITSASTTNSVAAITGTAVGSAAQSLGAGAGQLMMLPTLPALGTLHG